MSDIKQNLDLNEQEEIVIQSLRASSWPEFIGQDVIKKTLFISMEAAKKRDESLEHLLFYGPPGLGKTTLSHIIAKEMGANIRITSGPALERSGDLASILTNLSEGDVLFIDEIHRLNKVVEETLYPAMEDYALDIVIGKGPSARTLRMDLPKFTIIGATTKAGMISGPLRDRFGVISRLTFYNPKELSEIIRNAAKKLNVEIDDFACEELAARGRGTPRIALRLLKRARDYAAIHGQNIITKEIVDKTLSVLEIDKKGLDESDKRYLLTIIEKYEGGPVGLETIAASISEDNATLEEVIEPYLMQIGFIKRTTRGRMVTENALKHLGIKGSKKQEKLF
jgi:Holliday junction DNA helicase RuvB